MRRRERLGVGAGAVAAIMVAVASFAVGASPLMKSPSPSEPIASRLSLFRQALIYAKEGSAKLLDGRWNLGQSEAKLGVTLSAEETQQLMACTGQIVCATPAVEGDGEEVEYRAAVRVTASAVSVLRPDLLVTAKHVFFNGKRATVPFGSCSFRSFSRRKVAIPVVVEKDQRKGYVLNNEDFIVVRLKRELEGCSAFALNDADASLPEGEPILSVTGHQLHTLNKISDREPVVAKGNIKRVLDGVLGGPPFYYADLDLDDGGSGGAVFALKDGRPVADDDGRLDPAGNIGGLRVARQERKALQRRAKLYGDHRPAGGLQGPGRGQRPEAGCRGAGALRARRGGQDQRDVGRCSVDRAGGACTLHFNPPRAAEPRPAAKPERRKPNVRSSPKDRNAPQRSA